MCLWCVCVYVCLWCVPVGGGGQVCVCDLRSRFIIVVVMVVMVRQGSTVPIFFPCLTSGLCGPQGSTTHLWPRSYRCGNTCESPPPPASSTSSSFRLVSTVNLNLFFLPFFLSWCPSLSECVQGTLKRTSL